MGATMKCLSIKQPHADRIRSGVKTYEIRSWRTHYRGPLLICSGVRHDRRFPEAKSLPLGVSIAACELADVVPFEPHMADAACVEWRPGLFAWVLRDVNAVKPVHVKGQLGLFQIPNSVRHLSVREGSTLVAE